LQQSALDAQALPVPTQFRFAQRGTPTLSCLQVSCVSQLPAQQSHDELQVIVASLQTSPFGLQPEGSTQMPLWQTTGLVDVGSPASWNAAEPQQSLSF
jgi:hypothetical protein